MGENQNESFERVPVASTPQERFEEYMQSRGMRNTAQRKALLDHVFSYHDHFDAETLIDRLPSKGEDNHVSRATVYRALREFVEAGLLREFQLDGRSVYELDYGYPQHDHLYCEKCEKLIEFQSEELIKLLDQLGASKKFRVNGHRLIITGVCHECRIKNQRTRRKVDLI